MKINRDTLVCRLGGFETNLKLDRLLEIFTELYDIDYDEEIIQELNEEDESFIKDFNKDKWWLGWTSEND